MILENFIIAIGAAIAWQPRTYEEPQGRRNVPKQLRMTCHKMTHL